VIRAIVVMGVSGCGKSTLAAALATALGWQFVEGDTLHPARNIAKMRAGLPLDDEDRLPFLENVAAALAANRSGVVVSCSALKRSYRDRLRARAGDLLFVLPEVDRAKLVARLENRGNHFMPPSLLSSQLESLESPDADEQAIVVDGGADTDLQVSAVVNRLHKPSGH
jgi:gluconokinase